MELNSCRMRVEAFLKAATTKFNTIWLVGGAKLTEEFLGHDLIDEFNIFIMPLLLGNGIPLFPINSIERRLVLKAVTRMENDCIKLTYVNK